MKSNNVKPDKVQLLLVAKSLRNMSTLTLFNDIQKASSFYIQAAAFYREADQSEQADKVVQLSAILRLFDFRDKFKSLLSDEIAVVQTGHEKNFRIKEEKPLT